MTAPGDDDFLAIGPRIRALPILHGSGDFAIRVREEILARPIDCLAVPLPESFRDEVEGAIAALPAISIVARPDDDGGGDGFSYVPIDPCQGVVAAIRTAIGERIPRAYVDRETGHFEESNAAHPDPYALKAVSPAQFAAALLPSLRRPESEFQEGRIRAMAANLRDLQERHESILFVCSIVDWPWVREAFLDGAPAPDPDSTFGVATTYPVDPRSLIFALGELPFLTGLYERGRRELTDDENLSVDGVKEMILAARDRLRDERPRAAARVTPQLLGVLLRYVRNLSLMDRRLTPDLFTLVTAAKQTAGDDFALAIAETARAYRYEALDDRDGPRLRMGIGRADVPGFGRSAMANRLPGPSISWRTVELRPRVTERDKTRYRQRWDPRGMCSWPPEDDRIESFQRHVRDQARAILGADLARSEKFTSSVMDGIDIRETLRQWHTGDLYVRVIPPGRGSVEVVVFLFDVPADPRRYPHRATWYAEHEEESTLVFYATDPMADFVGPGIARAEYGGAMFLWPPRSIADPWSDRRLDAADTLEDRLVAAAVLHSRERHVAIVSPTPPTASWRRLARRHGKSIVHIPLKRFGGQLVERLRQFHILNGREVRSYAADFIRDA